MSTLTLLPLAALMSAFATIVMVLFVVVTLLLTAVILIQEGKGGGLAGAFGGAGADAFGVKAGTVNKFTAWLGALFLGLALLHSGLTTAGSQPDIEGDDSPSISIPEEPEAGTEPAGLPPAEAPTPETPPVDAPGDGD